MQAILLLGGKNSRFFPLETCGHKAMSKIYGKSLLEYTITDLNESGITEFIIVNGKYSKQVMEYFGDGSKFGINIQYASQLEPKGAADAILSAKELINDDFIIPNPYHVKQAEVYSMLIEKFRTTNLDGLIPGMKVEDINNYGALILQGDRVMGVVEKPEIGEEPSNYKATSAYIFKKEFIDYLVNEPVAEYAYESAYTKFSKDKNVTVFELDSTLHLSSLKYPWHLLKMRNFIVEGKHGYIADSAYIAPNAIVEDTVFVDEGAKIFEGACIKGHTYIGKNAVVGNNAVVRDSDLGEKAVVGVNADVTRTIFMDGATYHGGGFIGDSIIGNDCKIAAGFTTANKRTDRDNIKCTVKGKKIDIDSNALGVVMGKESKVGINSSTMPGVFIGEKCSVWPGAIVYRDLEHGEELVYKQS